MILLSPIRDEHIEDICDLYYYQFGREPGASNIEKMTLSYPSFVAYQDENILGFIITDFFSIDTLRIETIVVREDHRSKGVGTALLSILKQGVSETWRGLVTIDTRLFSCAGKIDNSSFFEKNDFQKVVETAETAIFFCDIE